MTGFEHAEPTQLARDKIVSTTGVTVYEAVTVHQNSGLGGVSSREFGGNSSNILGPFPQLREFVVVAALNVNTANLANLDTFASGTGVPQIRVAANATTGVLTVQRDTTVLASSAGGAFSAANWNWLHLWGRIDNAAGLAEARLGSWANLVAAASGVDTQNGAADYADQLRLLTGAGSVAFLDDVMVFARSLYWSAATGTTPVAGATITGPSGTAFVTHVFATGTKGCFFVRTVSGTFAPSDALTSGGWSATANHALANDEASLWVPEQYIIKRPAAVDSLTGWSFSTGANHATEVDDSAGTADYVSTTTAGQVDEYTTSGTLPAGAIVEALEASLYARLNGVSAADQIVAGLVDNAGNVYDATEPSPLSGAYEVHSLIQTRIAGAPLSSNDVTNGKVRATSSA